MRLSLAELMELEVPSPERTEEVLGPVRDRAAAGPPEELDDLDRQFWYACVGAVCERLRDHDGAVRYFGAGLAELDEDSDDWADATFRLATALHSRFTARGDLGDAGRAIELFRGVLDWVEDGDWPALLAAGHVARCLADRFAVTGHLADLTAATSLLETELAAAGEPPVPATESAADDGAGEQDSDKAATTDAGDDGEHGDHGDDSIQAGDIGDDSGLDGGTGAASGLDPDADPDNDDRLHTWIFVLDVLAECLREQAELAHDEALLARALRRSAEALALAGDDPAFRAAPEKGLARTLLTRAEWSRSAADLDEVIRLLDPAAPTAQAENPAARAVNLGLAHFQRYRLLGAPGDLAHARAALERAVAGLSAGSAAQASAQLNLAVVLREAAPHATHPLELLDEAVRLADEVVGAIPASSPLALGAVVASAEARVERQEHGGGGGAAELVAACRKLEAAAPHVPEGGGVLAASFRDAWGSTLVRLAGLSSDPELLDQGVRLLRQALADPGTLPHLPRTQGSLAAGLYERFLARGRMADLDEAVDLWRESVDARDPGAPHTVVVHGGLAVALHQRYDRRGVVADLDDAVQRLVTATELPSTPAQRAGVLINLGHAHQARYEATDDPDDLARAVTAQREALLLAAPGSGPEGNARLGLALALGAQGELTESLAAADEAMGHARRARDLADPASRVWVSATFGLAGLARLRHWLTGDAADRRSAEEHYGNGYAAARERYPAAAAEGAMEWGLWQYRLDRHSQAVAAFDLAEQAVGRLVAEQRQRAAKETWLRTSRGLPAATALAAWRGGDAEGAVTRLERTRALLLAERLRLAEPTRQVQDETPASRQAPDAPGTSGTSGTSESGTGRSSAGTVLYLVPGPDTGVAFALRDDGSVHPTPLPGLGEGRITPWRDIAWTDAAQLDRFARWAWDHVLAQVVPAEGTPVTLVPVGELVHLPWQTAYAAPPDLSPPRRPGFLLDAHAVGFTPGLGILPTRSVRRAPRYLGVAVSRSTGLRQLVHAEREIRAAAARFEDALILVDEEATPEAVLAWLADGGVAHFACHAETDPADPLGSALVLGGGARLAVRDLLGLRAGLDLVILSACATSVAGRELPDEVVGLPGTLLGAGAQGVVSAAWPVDDLAACLVMTDFVDRWAAGASPAEALRAAQTGLRDLGSAALARRLRVLRGPELDAPPRPATVRPFEALSDWGAFTYTGHAGRDVHAGRPHSGSTPADRTGDQR
ncbi:CHAT domain-containing protein [Streptomyces sp. NPDC002845]